MSCEREPDEQPSPFTGAKRIALDTAFRHGTVEAIFKELETLSKIDNEEVKKWAADTLATLQLRSPTSLKVALEAVRRGSRMTLLQALDMELKIAAAFCVRKFVAFSTICR